MDPGHARRVGRHNGTARPARRSDEHDQRHLTPRRTMEQLLLPVLMFAGLGALMFFSMKKQKRAAAATKQMHESLVPGARVMTTSGLHGTVTAVADDTIELEIAPGLRTTWVRAAVREVVVPGPGEAAECT